MRKILVILAAMTLGAPVALADAPISHVYQAQASTDCPNTSGVCGFSYPAIATAGNTVVQHVSCSFYMASGIPQLAYLNIPGAAAFTANVLPIFTYGISNGLTEYGINADTLLYFAQGQKPAVEVIGANNGSVRELNCTISGYY